MRKTKTPCLECGEPTERVLCSLACSIARGNRRKAAGKWKELEFGYVKTERFSKKPGMSAVEVPERVGPPCWWRAE